jgi:acyl dehydratase
MPINPDAVGAVSEPGEKTWTSKDALLYALGVGADTEDLAFTTENSIDIDQQVLPTMAVVLGGGGTGSIFAELGEFNPAMLVHGEQSVELHQPIPVSGTLRSATEITGIYDKGKGALVVLESKAVDAATDEPLFTTMMSAFIRGEGGWGGDRGPSGPRNQAPDRAPDHEVTYSTRPDQALIYRLSGDRNPLHSDPSFAAMAGFDRPILHGLCTFGFTGRALLSELCDGDPARFSFVEGRFTSPVFPGEDLTVRMWVDDGEAVYQTQGGDGRVVIDAGSCRFTSA